MEKPNKVLFIECKYCDAEPKHGITNAEHYLWNTLDLMGIESRKFHFDEYFFERGLPGDSDLIKLCKEFKPDMILLDWQNGSEHNPTMQSLHYMNYILRIPIVAIWWDHIWDVHIRSAEQIKPFVDLNVVVDAGMFWPRVVNSDTYLFLWTPEDPNFYHDDKKDVPISFIGRIGKPGRKQIVSRLEEIEGFVHAGGQRENFLTKEEYAKAYRRSKIAVNFSQSKIDGISQMVGHTMEATQSGCMLLEQDNQETAGMFVPYVDYVPWKDEDDLILKAKYYTEHEDERKEIAKNGNEKAIKYYNSDQWWNRVFDGLAKQLERNEDFELNFERLVLKYDLVPKFNYEEAGGYSIPYYFYKIREQLELLEAGKDSTEFKVNYKPKDAWFFNRELIAKYLKFKNIPYAVEYIYKYMEKGYKDKEQMEAFMLELDYLLSKIKKAWNSRKNNKLMIVFDSLRFKDVEKMPFLNSQKALKFTKAYSPSVYTRPSIKAMFTGEIDFKKKSYIVDKDKSPLLLHLIDNYTVQNYSSFKFFDGYADYPVTIFKEREGVFLNEYRKDHPIKHFTSELFWKYLCNPKDNTFAMFLCEEFHLPCIGQWHKENPIYLDASKHYTKKKFELKNIERQSTECLHYLDAQLQFLMSFIKGDIIVTSDHGQMVGEKGHLGGGLTWHDESMHVPLMFLGGQGQCDQVFSMSDFGDFVLNYYTNGKALPKTGEAIVERDALYDKKYKSKRFKRMIGEKYVEAFKVKVTNEGIKCL